MRMNKTGALSLKEVVRFLKQHDHYCVLCHSSPDGDTLGSAAALTLALRALGKECFIRCADEIPQKFSYFLTDELTQTGKEETVVAVDVADLQVLGSLMNDYRDRVDLCIDHHVSNTRFAARYYVDAAAAATCESIYRLIELLPCELTDQMAKALYTGIVTDTGGFKYANVTARTHLIAARLYSKNIDAAGICKVMFDTKSRARLELERMVLDGAQFYFDERCMVLTVTTAMMEQTGCSETDLEGVAVISRSVEGVIAGVSVKQKGPDTFKVSLRTYEPLDASAICRRLGGGGHKAAAGCTLQGTPESVTGQVLDVIGEALEEMDARTVTDQ